MSEDVDYRDIFAKDPGMLWQVPKSPDDLLDRRGIVRLDERQILDMLKLPEGTRIRAVRSSVDPIGVDVLIVHPRLPAQPAGADAPILPPPTVTVEHHASGGCRPSSVFWNF